jgi:hypothetical protein
MLILSSQRGNERQSSKTGPVAQVEDVEDDAIGSNILANDFATGAGAPPTVVCKFQIPHSTILSSLSSSSPSQGGQEQCLAVEEETCVRFLGSVAAYDRGPSSFVFPAGS